MLPDTLGEDGKALWSKVPETLALNDCNAGDASELDALSIATTKGEGE